MKYLAGRSSLHKADSRASLVPALPEEEAEALCQYCALQDTSSQALQAWQGDLPCEGHQLAFSVRRTGKLPEGKRATH